MPYKIYPYKMGSASAKRLATALNTKRVRAAGRYVPRINDVIINWGCSTPPNWGQDAAIVLNHWDYIHTASNKLSFMEHARDSGVGHLVPEWTSSKEVAREWNRDSIVVCRLLLQGHSGAGIHIAEVGEGIPDDNYKLYTKYVKKAAEYRVHVAGGHVLLVSQKRTRHEYEDGEPNRRVRSYANGWIFSVHDVDEKDKVNQAALDVMAACNLDFGAVDVVYNQHYDKAVCLEINTAPSLEGNTTLEKYTEFFESILHQ